MSNSHPLFYRRNLPHWQPSQTDFFITYRLHGSIPVYRIKEMQENYCVAKNRLQNATFEELKILEDDYFFLFDEALDKKLNEPYWLSNDSIASIVWDSLKFNDNKEYTLWSSCIMPNHVHILLSTLENSSPLDKILQNHKKFTASKCNKVLNRKGQFWQHESFDRIIRNDKHFNATVRYIINNPVKAGMAKNWEDWKWTYVHPQLISAF